VRPCCPVDGRSSRTYELTSSIVPRGTPFHHLVEFELPPMAFCLCWDYSQGFPGMSGPPSAKTHIASFHSMDYDD
jgi:hypothetical protein